jgi:hypothetical protein
LGDDLIAAHSRTNRDPYEALASDGVGFDERGVADPEQRLYVDDLAGLVTAAEGEASGSGASDALQRTMTPAKR